MLCPSAPAPQQLRVIRAGFGRSERESPVLDVIYLVATIALFALVGLIAKGVEGL